MKNLHVTIKLTLFFSFFITGILSAKKNEPVKDSLKGIEINARIYDLGSEPGAYKVEFLNSRSQVDSVILVNKEEFKFLLEKGKHCALRISKNNVIIRQINLFTNHPEKSSELERLHFHTDLSFDKDDDASGFPVGMVSIRSKVKTYGINENKSKVKRLEIVTK